MTGRILKPEAVFLIVAALLTLAGGAVFLLSRTTTLTVAVAPVGGTEPVLLKAFAETLRARDKDIRLRILPFDGVRESAQALASGKADLAVVRPDIALPENGQTLAILREQAVLIAAPETSGIKALPDLAGRRLGFIAERVSDRALIETLLAHESLAPAADGEALPEGGVALVGIVERELAQAFAQKRIDAVVARFALGRHVEARTMSAATLAIDAARATVARLAGAAPASAGAQTPIRVGKTPADTAPQA